MPKKSSTSIASADTELVAVGEFSTITQSALKSAGERISSAHLVGLVRSAESARQTFAVHALITGLLLLAKKESVAHGKFKPFCIEVMREAAAAKTAARCAFDEENGYRTARLYMVLAKRVMLQIEHPDVRNPVGARIHAIGKAAPAPETLPALAVKKADAIVSFFEQITQGWSLRELIRNLSESAKDVEDEGSQPSSRASGPQQTDFFAELTGDIERIQNRAEDPAFLALPKDKVISYAEALIREGKRLLARAKGESLPE